MAIKRLIALIIDSIIVGIVGAILGAIIGQELGFIISFIIGATYQAYFLSQMNGQTPGKMLLGIRVVKSGGGGISPVTAVIRYIGYYINTIVLLLGWIIGAITGRGFHDMIAGTEVVDA